MSRSKHAAKAATFVVALVVGTIGAATMVQAEHDGPHASCLGSPEVVHDDQARTSSLRLDCEVPYPDQPTVTATETVTEPAPPPTTVTVTATPEPSPTSTSPEPTEPTTEPTTEPPAPSGVMWGACPGGSGGASAAAAKRVTDKWGSPVYVRQFNSASSTLTWNAVPAGALMHRSYKPPTTITDAQIDALLLAARGHMVTFWHESDNDGLSATARAARIALMNRLYDRNVALGRPAIIVPTFTGGFFADYGSEATRDLWADVKGDLIGLDADGIHSYGTDYDDEVDEVLEWIEENPEYRGWAVPEFGTSRQSSDPSGSGRAAWIREQVGYFEAADPQPVAVAWYDYDSTTGNSISEPSPEWDVYHALVESNAGN